MLGISRDTPAENLRFREKFAFPYDLLSDEDGAVGQAYGVGTYPGTEYPERITYLIDPEGRIREVYGEVKPDTHPGEVLRDLG